MSTSSEIVYALDTSKSISADDIEKMKDFLMSEIKQHTPVSRVALVNFGADATIESGLTSQEEDLFKAIENLKKIGGVRRIDLAIRRIRDDIFTRRLQNLPLRQIIVITSGANNLQNKDALVKVITEVKESDKVKVVVVGVGDNKNELDNISSDEGLTVQIDSFDKMPSIVDDIFSVISENAGMI